MLRCIVNAESSGPVGLILQNPAIHFELHGDVETMDSALHEAALQADIPFDLSAELPIRLDVWPVGRQAHLLLITIHHMVADGLAIAKILRDLDAFYTSGGDADSELPKARYADFVERERAASTRHIAQAHLRIPEMLSVGATNLTKFTPTDSRPSGGRVSAPLPDTLRASELRVCKQLRVTRFMLRLAAVELVLSRYSDADGFLLAWPTSRRTAGDQDIVGMFVETEIAAVSLGAARTIRDVISGARAHVIRSLTPQGIPFETMVSVMRKAGVPDWPDRIKVSLGVDTLFELEPTLGNLSIGALRRGDTQLGHSPPAFDVAINFWDTENESSVTLDYNTAVVDPSAVAKIPEQLVQVLEQIAEAPDRELRDVRLLSAPERYRLLVEWNRTEAEYPQDKTLAQLFEEQAARTPDSVALVEGEGEVSYGELNRRANRLGHRLLELGVGPEKVVGICGERSVELVVGLLGIVKAGAAYLPLDPSYPQERLTYMLEDAGARVLLVGDGVGGDLSGGRETVELSQEWSKYPETNPASVARADNLAYVIYTSGSTGKPKGVMVEHRSVVNATVSRHSFYKMGSDMRFLLFSSISFDSSVAGIFGTLLIGGSLVLVPERGVNNLMEVTSAISNSSVTHILCVPDFYRQLISTWAKNMGVLACVTVAGQMCYPEVVEAHRHYFGDAVLLCNEYGPTECTVWTTAADITRNVSGLPPIGKPIQNTQVYVLDGWGEPVPVGVAGELYIGGTGVARGYLGQPELTAERFTENRFGEGRLYRTGDLVRWREDGNLEFVGRRDEQVKIRGYRIELGEIEECLRTQAGVKDAVVAVLEGEAGQKRLVGYVVGAVGGLSFPDVEAALRRELPEYMVPGAWVKLERVPLTPNGKVDRRSLPTPDVEERLYEAPSSGVEAELCRIWEQVLGVERVGIHDNFFELGGDSILSIRVVAQAREAGLGFRPSDVFERATVAALVEVVSRPQEIEAEQGLVEGEVELTPIQRWLLEQELEHPEHFNQSMLLEVAREATAEQVERALEVLVRQHDALRLRFWKDGQGRWRQEQGEVWMPRIENHDLRGLAEARQQEELRARAAEIESSHRLETGRLFKAAWYELGGSKRPRLQLSVHHLVVDLISWRVLLSDLEKLLDQQEKGERLGLSSKTTSYQQWAAKLVEYAGSPTLQQELEYWLAVLPETVTEIPLDSHVENSANQRWVEVELDEEQTKLVLREATQAYRARVDELLLGALVEGWRRWSGQPGLLLDVEGHGREDLFAEVDLTRTVGWFTNIYPVWLEASDGDLLQTLAGVKQRMREVPRRGLGYGVLRYLSEHAEELGRKPEAAVSFNYLGQFEAELGEKAGFRHVGGLLERYPGQRRREVLGFTAQVLNRRLRMTCAYRECLFDAETVGTLLRQVMLALEEEVNSTEMASASYLPSDFPLADLSEGELSRILAPRLDERLRLTGRSKSVSEDRYRAVLVAQGSSPTLRKVWTEAYGEDYPDDVEPLGFVTITDLARVYELLQIRSGHRVIDLACGRGGPGLWIARKSGAFLVGLDIVAEAIGEAEKRKEAFGVRRAEFRVASITETGLPTASFDAAMSIDALWMLIDKMAALREAARILRPGGRFVFTTWEPSYLDYGVLLQAAGLSLISREVTPNWKSRQLAVYDGLLRHETELRLELGVEAANVLLAEAREAPSMLEDTPRLMYLAIK